jgi:hypothetical protein
MLFPQAAQNELIRSPVWKRSLYRNFDETLHFALFRVNARLVGPASAADF